MADYLKIFSNKADYDAYIESGYPKPNVSYIEDTDETIFTNYKDEPAGPESTLVGIAPEDWPSSVTTIGLGNGTAANEPLRRLIKSIIIPEGVTGFNTYGLRNLPWLTDIVLPSTMTSIPDASELNNMVRGTNLTRVTLPSTMTSLGSYCLYSGRLSEIYISDLSAYCRITMGVSPFFGGGYPNYSTHLFLNGKEILDLVTPDDVTTIGIGQFDNFNSFTSIKVSEGVTTIGNSAFLGCKSVTTVDLPSTLTRIQYSAFQTCTSLQSVTVRATTPPNADNGIFNYIDTNFVIYVPAESVETYKAASGWSNYASKIQAIPA